MNVNHEYWNDLLQQNLKACVITRHCSPIQNIFIHDISCAPSCGVHLFFKALPKSLSFSLTPLLIMQHKAALARIQALLSVAEGIWVGCGGAWGGGGGNNVLAEQTGEGCNGVAVRRSDWRRYAPESERWRSGGVEMEMRGEIDLDWIPIGNCKVQNNN
jgi:hypothetical protein